MASSSVSVIPLPIFSCPGAQPLTSYFGAPPFQDTRLFQSTLAFYRSPTFLMSSTPWTTHLVFSGVDCLLVSGGYRCTPPATAVAIINYTIDCKAGNYKALCHSSHHLQKWENPDNVLLSISLLPVLVNISHGLLHQVICNDIVFISRCVFRV